ncbi:uncharacterized protein [Dysidea avara]|uniref:uncharacterized protein isoform X2 n=1 Tax=Dysidea avara TaxID=196820 RepID=UPI00331BD780
MQLVWLVVLWLLGVVVSQMCPIEIEQCNYATSRQDTNDAVTETLVNVVSTIVGTPIEEGSERELYETVSTGLGINATSEGFVRFQEAVNEIAVASLQECSRPESERVSLDNVTDLAMTFHQLLNNSNITEAREVYGKLVCLLSLSQQPEVGSRKKRQDDESKNQKELDDFFDNLEGEILATIFGLQYTIINLDGMLHITRPTLAFVVDDTGSMGEEIASVQRLIRSFVRTERTNPVSYILTTFNDPEVGVPMKYRSDDLTELMALEAAVDALDADGGGDCPELGMNGTLNALSLSNPDSNIIILTDAEPKDINLTSVVIETAKILRNSIHLFLSNPSCGNTDPYVELANATNGIVVNSITDFEAFADFADAALTFQFEVTTGGSKRQVDDKCLRFVVSVFTVEVRILFMARNHTLNITIPDGNMTSLHINDSIGVYYDEQPQNTWIMSPPVLNLHLQGQLQLYLLQHPD